MEAVVESSVFGGSPGSVVGPFKLEDGWHLIRIETLHCAELNDDLRETIKDDIFADWFNERLRKAKIKMPMLEEAARVEPGPDLAVVNE